MNHFGQIQLLNLTGVILKPANRSYAPDWILLDGIMARMHFCMDLYLPIRSESRGSTISATQEEHVGYARGHPLLDIYCIDDH